MQKETIASNLAELFKRLFAVNSVNFDCNFFDLGINSIELMNYSRMIAREFGIDFNVLHLYEYPTINLLADFFFNSQVKMEID